MNYLSTPKHPVFKRSQKLTFVENAGCYFLNLEDNDNGNNIPYPVETLEAVLKLGYWEENDN